MTDKNTAAHVCGFDAAVYTAAIDKLRDEMAADGGGTINIVGETLTALLCRHRHLAEKLGAKGKSIAGSMDAMKAKAKKQAKNGAACLDFWTGMQIVLKYFGIEDITNDDITHAQMEVFMPRNAPESGPALPSSEETLDIDALLAMTGGEV